MNLRSKGCPSDQKGDPTILSTKVLSPSQKSLVLNAGLRLVAYNAIEVDFLKFEIPKKDFEALIFTSQNGVKSYLKKTPLSSKDQITLKTFCVGEKTKQLLQASGFMVCATASSAKELGEIIVQNHKELKFLWLAGNQRRPELPEILNKNKVIFSELTTYKTVAHPKKIESNFDGILFFSPSAVSSFVQENTISGVGFCIGNTTAQEIKKYTDNYKIAHKPTIENVIVQAVNYFNSVNEK